VGRGRAYALCLYRTLYEALWVSEAGVGWVEGGLMGYACTAPCMKLSGSQRLGCGG